jgi:hypothetical protein
MDKGNRTKDKYFSELKMSNFPKITLYGSGAFE